MSESQQVSQKHEETDGPTHEMQATTGMENDAAEQEQTVSNLMIINKNLVQSSATSYIQGIKQFFEKPVIIKKGNTTGTLVTEWGPISMPSYQFQNFPIVNTKLLGYLGFRSTMCFRIQFNSNPFQQGLYFLNFTHTGGAYLTGTPGTPTLRSVQWYNMHNATIRQRTQTRRAEVNLGCDTQAILKIPYVSSKNYFPISGANTGSGMVIGDIGMLALQVYSPLVTGVGGSNSCGYTIWMHHEDIELLGPAGPQSGFEARDEQVKAGVGPISGPASVVRRLAGVFNRVPLLSQYATPVSWVSELVQNAAESVGWSAPSNLGPANRMTRHILPYHGNVDAIDNSQPISWSAKNEVDKLPGFSGTDTDEMDLSFMSSIPSFHDNVAFSISNNAGDQLAIYSVAPQTFADTLAGGGGSIYNNYTPIAFLASCFKYWRGGITFHLKFVKTQFHSGRIAVSYYPGYQSSGSYDVSFGASDYVFREVLDLRTMTAATITVPYMYHASYCGNQSNTGRLVFHVVDPLVAPASVATAIRILVEVSGAPDFEVAVPFPNAQMATGSITPQSGITRDDCALVTTGIGGSSISHDSFSNAVAAIGERISSWRQLLKVNSPLTGSGTAGYGGTVGTGAFGTIIPYAYSIGHFIVASPPSPSANNYVFQDMYSTIAPIFALGRGGMRIKSTQGNYNATPANMTLITMRESDVAFNVVGFGNTFDFTRAATSLETYSTSAPRAFCPPTDQALEVQVGAYGPMYARSNVDCIINDQYANSNSFGYRPEYTSSAPPVAVVLDYMNTGQITRIYRSAADDFSLGCFVSIPVMR